MNIDVNLWLQEAIEDFLRDWTSTTISNQHPESKDCYISTEIRNCTGSHVIVKWEFNPNPRNYHSRVNGEAWYAPREALQLFLLHGPALDSET